MAGIATVAAAAAVGEPTAGPSATSARVRCTPPSRSAFLRISWMRLMVVSSGGGDPRNLAEHRHGELVLQGARVVDRAIEELAAERGGGSEHDAEHDGDRHDLQRLRLDRVVGI